MKCFQTLLQLQGRPRGSLIFVKVVLERARERLFLLLELYGRRDDLDAGYKYCLHVELTVPQYVDSPETLRGYYL